MIDPVIFPVPAVIETRRLNLRSFQAEDASELHKALDESSKQLRQYLWFLPWVAEESTLITAEIRCRKAEANFHLRTDLPYLVFERSSGSLVGSVGLHRTDWQLPKTEVGYWIRTGATGKGYAAEAVSELVSWASEKLQAKRIELVTDEENIGSRRVAEKCGFVLEGTRRNDEVSPSGSLRHNCVYAIVQTAV